MNFSNIKTALWLPGFVSAALLFGGCGGGSGAGSDTIASEQTKPADSGNAQQASARVTGLFIDTAPVANLTYTCDDKTAQTDTHGFFACEQMPVSFSIGKIVLGQLESMPNADAAVFSQNTLGLPSIATRHPQTIRLSSFLALLDDDGDLANGIRISAESLNIINTSLASEIAFEKLDDTTLQNLSEQIVDANMNRARSYQYTQLSGDNITRQLSIAVAKSYHIE